MAQTLLIALIAAVVFPSAGSAPHAATQSPQDAATSPASSTVQRWTPQPGTGWQWQLSGPLDTSVDVPVYDVDMVATSAAVVAELHAEGRHVICYIDVGAVERFRPDASDFPAQVIGRSNGWPGERWLDIRRIDVLGPIMAERFDECAAKGFDAVEPDLVDGFAHDTGFRLTAEDQLRYNLFIARLAHERGLAVGLKNDLTQIPALLSSFDFAVDEECARYHECQLLEPFIAAGKPVFHAEYDLPTSVFCPVTTALGFSSIRKNLNLDAWREPCDVSAEPGRAAAG